MDVEEGRNGNSGGTLRSGIILNSGLHVLEQKKKRYADSRRKESA